MLQSVKGVKGCYLIPSMFTNFEIILYNNSQVSCLIYYMQLANLFIYVILYITIIPLFPHICKTNMA